MTASADNRDSNVPPGADVPDKTKTANEEPQMALEPDLPSDGRDEEGDAMIRNLPQRPELSEPPSQPDPLSNNS